MKRSFVDLKNARKGEYKSVIEEIQATGRCPFCPKYFAYHKKPILKALPNWILTENSWPYKNTRFHFILIGKKHKEKLSQLTQQDYKEIFSLMNWAIAKYNIKGGAVVARFGDTRFTGSSVAHIHFHLISPQIKNKNTSKKVLFPIGG